MVKRWQIRRAWRHWVTTHKALRRLFNPSLLDELEALIKVLESSHSGEVELVIEAHLPWGQALLGLTARQRAMAVFSNARVWDTEHNNGVLIYVLLADRAVEIVADRGFNALVTPEEWQAVCSSMQEAFSSNCWGEGLKVGLAGVSRLLERHYPVTDDGARNELPDRPILL